MKRPQNNGLFEVTGGQEKERGFCCMKLINFLSANNVTDWDEWHGAHLSAMSGRCSYASQCPIHERTIAVVGRRPIQFSLF
jgi:hypothetical protein|nr:MAG TPA: hypothetical protein [Caudoviricetes sp.]